MADVSLANVAEVAAGGASAGGGFIALRWLINWVTGRYDRRQERLDAEHDALDMSWKDYRVLLERRQVSLERQVASLERQSRAVLSAFQHVSAGLIRRDPHAPELVIAERLMAAAFPTDFTMAAQMAGASLDLNEGARS